jgi:hypothetical protein
MNALLCVGCNRYTHLPDLSGAEKDAKTVYSVLENGGMKYSDSASLLLLSPTAPEITAALNQISSSGSEVETLTFFFAGHGGVKAGSFYLCTSESTTDRLSMTAYPIVSLFQMIGEFSPRQVNIIIDACEAGGSAYDLPNLLKPEIAGSANSSSVAFLGACTANQSALENSGGGILTNELVRCFNGYYEIQTKALLLDLIEVGLFISPKVTEQYEEQKPIVWGLSLYGRGAVTGNPHYNPDQGETHFHVQNVPPGSAMGSRIRSLSPKLWSEYREMKTNPCPRRLLTLFSKVCGDSTDTGEIIAVLEGLSGTLSVRARESSDLMAAWQSLATAAIFFLPRIMLSEPAGEGFVKMPRAVFEKIARQVLSA